MTFPFTKSQSHLHKVGAHPPPTKPSQGHPVHNMKPALAAYDPRQNDPVRVFISKEEGTEARTSSNFGQSIRTRLPGYSQWRGGIRTHGGFYARWQPTHFTAHLAIIVGQELPLVYSPALHMPIQANPGEFRVRDRCP